MKTETTVSGALSDGRWRHVALVLDTQTNKTNMVRFYLDGVRQTDMAGYEAEMFGRFRNDKLYIGSRGNSAFKFSGELDDVRITGRALAPAEFLAERSKARGMLICIF